MNVAPLSVVAFLVVGCTAPATAPEAAAVAPRLEVGDHWVFEDVSQFARSTRTATRTLTVEEVTTHAGVEAYLVRSVSVARWEASGTAPREERHEARQWWRASDRASMESRGTSTPRGIATAVTYTPPCAELRFPVQEGMAWQEPCNAVVVTNGKESRYVRWVNVTVAGSEAVTVPAGTFDALRLEGSESIGEGRSQRTQWFNPSCGIVKTVIVAPSVTTTEQLVEGSCQRRQPPASYTAAP